MIRHAFGTALAASALLLQAGGAVAQNSSDPATTAPPTGSDRPSTTTPPTSSDPPPARTEEPAPRAVPTEVVPVPVIVPQTQTAPAPIQLPADTPYPNGFADPTGTYGNDLSVQVRESEGFDWGLLGLLGLLGLFGLYRRRDGYSHVVRSERYEDDRLPPRR